jgi:hypothetical protein
MYTMIVKSSSTVSFWEDCKAATERGAKCEAWKRFGAGYNGDVVEVAIKHADGQYQPVASRVIGVNTKWSTLI